MNVSCAVRPSPEDETDGVEEPRPSAWRRGSCPDEGEQHEEGDERRVQAVDLCDDRLTPRGLGRGREQPGGDGGAAGEPQGGAASAGSQARRGGRALVAAPGPTCARRAGAAGAPAAHSSITSSVAQAMSAAASAVKTADMRFTR